MHRLSTFSIVMAMLVAGSSTAIAAPEKDRTLVLFGASWCAPCIGEVRSIAAIAAAAAPDRVVIAWTDDGIARLRLAPPGNVEVATPARARELLSHQARDTAGLPFSVLIDARGKRCATWSRPLTAAAVAAMKQACEGKGGS